MARIFGRLSAYWVAMAIALFLMFTELAVELVQPLIMAKIIDEGLLKEDAHTVGIWGSILVGMSLFAFAAGVINTFYSAHVSQSFGYSLRKDLYQTIQYFTNSTSSMFATSSLITRLTNDIIQVQNTIFMGLRFLLRAPLLIIGGILMSLIVDVKLGLILAITIPVIIFMFFYVINKGSKLFKLVQEKLDRVNNVMLENLTAMRLIRAYVRHQYEKSRFLQASNNLKENTETALRLMEITVPFVLFLMNMSILCILWFGSVQINNGTIQIGKVVAIINYSLRITSSLSVITMLIMVISRLRASTVRLSEVFEQESKDNEKSANGKKQLLNGKISFENVTFRYPNSQSNALNHLTFAIQEKELVAVLGATGSGKSSLFQLIPRLFEPTEGHIYIDNEEIDCYSLESLRKQIGYVPQQSLLFTGTVKENILWGNPKGSFEDVVKAAKDAQIHDTIMLLPDKYETKIGQKGANLSGGQKQRIAIARALIRKPKMLLLDDSTSALDIQTERQLLQALTAYNCTIFLITQKISTAQKADKIMLMDDGKLLAFDTPENIQKTNDLYQKIVLSQREKGEEQICSKP
ncbi:ABC transporter ATP-binding protein [Niallia sp. NCCP-28]|uniref:ABC transporter ATP-binding protein n=1 Tax=Niallia sp. NCCP-28 TaxID=2934712 RepID=UPI00207F657A|nr:ABC transporter ATP-binding protein [Niallia sp. NCCP-28]GKU84455.1 putative ABC transporter ATP-binding protein YfiB [Niallia sp. NCCP-28]